MNKAAITADFSDLRTVKTRKVVQLIFEISAENAKHALDVLGFPSSDRPIPVAIAKLMPEAKRENPDAKARYASASDPERAVARAGMLSSDRAFQEWMHRSEGPQPPSFPSTEAGAAAFIRKECGVVSRSEIATSTDALGRFLALETEFLMASGRMASPQ